MKKQTELSFDVIIWIGQVNAAWKVLVHFEKKRIFALTAVVAAHTERMEYPCFTQFNFHFESDTLLLSFVDLLAHFPNAFGTTYMLLFFVFQLGANQIYELQRNEWNAFNFFHVSKLGFPPWEIEKLLMILFNYYIPWREFFHSFLFFALSLRWMKVSASTSLSEFSIIFHSNVYTLCVGLSCRT